MRICKVEWVSDAVPEINTSLYLGLSDTSFDRPLILNEGFSRVRVKKGTRSVGEGKESLRGG